MKCRLTSSTLLTRRASSAGWRVAAQRRPRRTSGRSQSHDVIRDLLARSKEHAVGLACNPDDAWIAQATSPTRCSFEGCNVLISSRMTSWQTTTLSFWEPALTMSETISSHHSFIFFHRNRRQLIETPQRSTCSTW